MSLVSPKLWLALWPVIACLSKSTPDRFGAYGSTPTFWSTFITLMRPAVEPAGVSSRGLAGEPNAAFPDASSLGLARQAATLPSGLAGGADGDAGAGGGQCGPRPAA